MVPRPTTSLNLNALREGVYCPLDIQGGKGGPPREPTLLRSRFIWEQPSTERLVWAALGDATVSKTGHIPAGGRAAANRFVRLKVLVLSSLLYPLLISQYWPSSRALGWADLEERGRVRRETAGLEPGLVRSQGWEARLGAGQKLREPPSSSPRTRAR